MEGELYIGGDIVVFFSSFSKVGRVSLVYRRREGRVYIGGSRDVYRR